MKDSGVELGNSQQYLRFIHDPNVKGPLQTLILKKNSILKLILLGIIFLIVAGTILVYQNRMLKGQELESSDKKIPVSNYVSVAPSPSILPSPTISENVSLQQKFTPTPTKIPLFSLYFYGIDYSSGEPKDHVVGAKVRLFDEKGNFITESITSEVVTRNNIGTGGNASFSVNLGTYKAIIEKGNLQGETTVTIKSFNDIQYNAIYVYAKPITISGKYFFDANKNSVYDNEEQVFSDKKVDVFVRTAVTQKLYSAGSTKTDSFGDFSITITPSYVGSYALGAEYVSGYMQPPQRWIDLSGGESARYDIYLWPL